MCSLLPAMHVLPSQHNDKGDIYIHEYGSQFMKLLRLSLDEVNIDKLLAVNVAELSLLSDRTRASICHVFIFYF